MIGVVVGKGGDTFRVDIGSADTASLSFMAFEGATKKNRPNIAVGDVVYAKLLVASRDMEPELVCVDSYGKKGRDSGLHQIILVRNTIGLLFVYRLLFIRGKKQEGMSEVQNVA